MKTLIFKCFFEFVMDFKEIKLMQVGAIVQSRSELYCPWFSRWGIYLHPVKETLMLFINQICTKEKNKPIPYTNASQLKFRYSLGKMLEFVPCFYQRIAHRRSLWFYIHKFGAMDLLLDNFINRPQNITWLINKCKW